MGWMLACLFIRIHKTCSEKAVFKRVLYLVLWGLGWKQQGIWVCKRIRILGVLYWVQIFGVLLLYLYLVLLLIIFILSSDKIFIVTIPFCISSSTIQLFSPMSHRPLHSSSAIAIRGLIIQVTPALIKTWILNWFVKLHLCTVLHSPVTTVYTLAGNEICTKRRHHSDSSRSAISLIYCASFKLIKHPHFFWFCHISLLVHFILALLLPKHWSLTVMLTSTSTWLRYFVLVGMVRNTNLNVWTTLV